MTACEYLEQTRDHIQGLCSNLTAAQANWRTTPLSWTIGEILEHLTIAERMTLLGIRRAMQGAPATGDDLAKTQGMEDIIVGRVPMRTSRIIAPQSIAPGGSVGAWPAALEGFLAARMKTLEADAKATEDFDRRVFPHPVLGKLTLRQWLLFGAAHSERHAGQIEELLKQLVDLQHLKQG